MAAANPSSRRRSMLRGALVGIALCAASYTIIWGDYVLRIPLSENFQLRRHRMMPRDRRQLGYLDSEPSSPLKYGRTLIDQNFQSLVRPSGIDSSIFRKMTQATHGAGDKGYDESTACDNIFLLMPYSFGHNGHGSQLNNFILAALVATFTNRAMVVLEPPPALNVFHSNSQFGCPPEAWETQVIRTGAEPKKVGWNKDFPSGLSRLLKHPAWLSRQCAVPCPEYTYEDWDELHLMNNYTEVPVPKEITCPTSEEGGKTQNVLVLSGQQVRDYFISYYKDKMLYRVQPPSLPAAEWALRLGAAPHEARVFGGLTERHEIWDYISGIMIRSGIMRWQPWIARDAEAYIHQIEGLPLDEPYDAIHVRRGDKLESDARRFVIRHWQLQGLYDEETGEMPMNYIPFSFYLKQFDDEEYEEAACTGDEPVRLVYVATDDPMTVQGEIDEFPKDSEGNSIINTMQSCRKKIRFIFGTSPSDQTALVGYHLDEGPSKGDCEERYRRNIAGIADLMILAKADIFIGEFNSNWGRLVRTFRLKVNDSTKILHGARPVLKKEMRVAWGNQQPGPPGW
eukprot:CAMPEP_0183715970 /NCGR_PEP_ID=MMETSP0737-20130205/10017_1 /TAXON_ID=385413 /ORGANISM="Thalassiosira miniscula, Strain CCMP1093" /LENGTH=566 /DNA_ID=CAMNT_0025945157 /DNA_START=75 /DNA_END=1775 /DNA_ORIENTATION=+